MRKVYFNITSRRRDFTYTFYLIGGIKSPLPLPMGITSISNKIWVEDTDTGTVALVKNRGLDDMFSPDEFAFAKLSAIFANHNDIYELTGFKVS